MLVVEELRWAAGLGIRRRCGIALLHGLWREALCVGVHIARVRGIKLFVEELWVQPSPRSLRREALRRGAHIARLRGIVLFVEEL